MANTKVTQHVIANNAITADQISSAAVTDAKLHSTLDLSGKTLTLPATAIPSASTATTQSASDNSTKLATTAYVTTAIANLNDSAPAALNTLNELAAALGDDANFSGTITTSLAAKAPLANPTFTGSISHGSNLTLDVVGGITLDADGGQVDFKDAGTLKALIDFTGNNVEIQSRVTDADLLLRGQDGSSFITALTLDMSEAGFATFNDGGAFGGTGALRIPQGTTGQRPSAETGQIRWNTTDGALEVYNGTAWTAVGAGSSNKILDTFTGDGSNATFTLSVTPANEDAIMVFIDGAYQEKSDYTLTNNSLVLDTAPLNNEKIAVHTTTASVHDGTSAVNQQFTATANQTDFTLSQDPKSENNTQVYINGVYQQKTDYTVTGTTLAFDTGLTVGDVVEVNMFTVATLGNTDTVTEGVSNLYHTTARARGAISVSGNAISYNSSTGVLTANFEEGPSFTSSIDVAGNITVGNNDSILAENNLRFKSGGAAYIDHNTVGQDIQFRISNSSALDTTIMTLDAGVGSVGINQTAPSSTYKLDVGGAIRSAGAAPSLVLRETDTTIANQDWLLGSYNGTFAIRDVTGSTYPVYIEQATPSSTLYLDSTGNVGIGTGSPGGPLHIKSDTNKTLITDFTMANGTGTYTWHSYQRNGVDKWRVGGSAGDAYLSFYNDAGSSHQLGLASNGKIFINISPGSYGSYTSLGDFIFKQSADNLGIGVIDSDAANTFKFINNGTEAKIAYNAALPIKFYTSDTTKQFEIHNSGAIKSSQGGMVLQTKEEYNGTAASVTGSGTTVVVGMDITVKEGSKVAVWFHSGQILNSSTGTNPNGHLQWVNSGGTVTDISDHNHNHYWWDQTDNIDRNFFSTQGMSGALSAGTYNIRFLGGTYQGTTTWNYQSKGAHLIVQEIAAN